MATYYSTANGTGVSVPTVGGVVLGVTSATNTNSGKPITRTFPINTLSTNLEGGNLPKQTTGVNTVTFASATTGTFAYQPGHILYGYTRTLNGSANTAVAYNSSKNVKHKYLRLKGIGAKTSTAFRAGYYNIMGISAQRSNWSTAPATNLVNHVSTSNNANPAVDEAIYVTYKSVPGEFVYLDGSPTPIQDNYEAR